MCLIFHWYLITPEFLLFDSSFVRSLYGWYHEHVRVITYLCVSIRFGVCLGLQNISILLQKNVFSIPFFIDRFTMWQTQNHVDQTGKRVSFFEIRNKATTCPMSPSSQAYVWHSQVMALCGWNVSNFCHDLSTRSVQSTLYSTMEAAFFPSKTWVTSSDGGKADRARNDVKTFLEKFCNTSVLTVANNSGRFERIIQPYSGQIIDLLEFSDNLHEQKLLRPTS